MKRKVFKYMSVFIATFLLCLSFGCGSEDGLLSVKESDVTFWSVHNSEKVLQDKPMEDYSSIAKSANIELRMAKGEYEGAQIIVTPKTDVHYYSVTVSDLYSGEDKISKDNILIYHERYIPVTKNGEKNGAPKGMYPDALVPMEAIIDRDENKIKANENQGVFLSFETELNQPAGEYKGEVTFDFKSFTKKIPVSIEVLNVTVSEEVRAKSCFLTRWRFGHGELNTSQEMVEAYNDALIEYRLAPEFAMNENTHSEEDIKRYVDLATNYLLNPRCSCISFPYLSSTTECGYETIDRAVFEKYLWAFINKSLELNVDLLKKTILYNGIIDEATLSRNLPAIQVQTNALIFNETVEKVASELENDPSITSSLKVEIANSIRKIPHIGTFGYDARYADYSGNSYINTFCPFYNGLDTESQRQLYYQSEKSVELWWYGCNSPLYPYTSYHVDITDTLPTRLLSWMQAEYEIDGNLYWAVNDYVLEEDYFGTDAMRTLGVNMEGVLFYPGGQYGLDKPIPSMRLEGIRDGMEEYELLISLKEKYQSLGLNADEFIASLREPLYTGARNIADSKSFEKARNALLDICLAIETPGNLCITGSKDDGAGTMSTEVYLKGDYVLKNNGVAVTDKVEFNDGYLYTVYTPLTEEDNLLNLSYEANSKEYTYVQHFGGKVITFNAQDLAVYFEMDTAELTASLVEGSTIEKDGKFVRLDVKETEGSYQMISLISKELNSKLNSSTKKIMFNLYNNSDESIEITVSVKYKQNDVYTAAPSCVLNPKSSTIVEFSVGGNNWKNSGEIQRIRFWLGKSNTESAKIVYLKSISVYGK